MDKSYNAPCRTPVTQLNERPLKRWARDQNLRYHIFSFIESSIFEHHVSFSATFLSVTLDLRVHDPLWVYRSKSKTLLKCFIFLAYADIFLTIYLKALLTSYV